MCSMFSDAVNFNDMTLGEWEELCDLAEEIYENPSKYNDFCKGKIIATLFYEPSTRTVFSFQTAMQKLGGGVIGFTGTAASSVSKGENLRDTVKIVSNYADIIVIRHYLEGAAFAAAVNTTVPVINAGDGGHLHPTQTMLDLFTIKMLKGKLTNLKIGICGDLLNGRTVHSLLNAFSYYKNNVFYLISTDELKIPGEFLKLIRENNKLIECKKIEDYINDFDIIYMTRIQRERFKDMEEYDRQRKIYILDTEKLARAKSDLLILHPLPKVDEIAVEVDDDERAAYFRQAGFGLYIRMALIIKLLEKSDKKIIKYSGAKKCKNDKCILREESYLPDINKESNGKVLCAYCEHEI